MYQAVAPALVSGQRRSVHIVTEMLAVTVAAPVLWNIASSPHLTSAHRDFLRVLAVGTLVVDGWLLWRWKQSATAL